MNKLKTDFSIFPIIETERLILRAVSKEDLQQIFVLRSDERLMTYIDRPRNKTENETKEFLKKIFTEQKQGKSITWALTLKPNEQLIGTVCFWNIDTENFCGELGYSLHYNYHKKGLMQEAIKAILPFGFSQINFNSIRAYIRPENSASIKTIEQCGFIKEAQLRENTFFEGKFYDTCIYSRLSKEYK